MMGPDFVVPATEQSPLLNENDVTPPLLPSDSSAGKILTVKKQLQHYGLITVLSVLFLTTVSAIPILNKYIFSCLDRETASKAATEQCAHLYRGLDKKAFDYPLTVTFLQLCFCWIVLGIYNVLSHLWSLVSRSRYGYDTERNQCEQYKKGNSSWMFDENLLYKMRYIIAPGFCFGIKFGITNFGLSVVSANVHLLLQATSLAWTVLFAYLLTNERPGYPQLTCCLLTIIGTILISYDFQQSTQAEPYKLLVNLFTPFMEGITIVYLRKATKELIIDDPRRVGISAPELTALKLFISSMTVLPFWLLKEGFPEVFKRMIGQSSEDTIAPFWEALATTDSLNIGLIVLCASLTLIFQTNITCLASIAGAVSVGLVGDIKVVPQTLMADGIFHTWGGSTVHWSGAVLVMISGGLYGITKIIGHQKLTGHSTKDKTFFITGRQLLNGQ